VNSGLIVAQTADAGPSEQWFALQVNPRHEKAVYRTLQARSYESVLPVYRTRHIYGARVREYELPLFPGYVFCRFSLESRSSVLQLPSVAQVLGFGGVPAAINDAEIESLRAACRARVPMKPWPYVEVGETVQIKEGPFAGISGKVVQARKASHLVLSISLLRRSVLLELDELHVASDEPISMLEYSGNVNR
jgi:transcription antitermination factor NusG